MNNSYLDLVVVTNLLDKSLKDLISNDNHLFEIRIGELMLNHRLAVYLECNLPVDYADYNVDCEYFRDSTENLHDRKKLGSKKTTPDIIIHKRGNNFPTNYLIIEAKRDNPNDKKDIERIKSMIENDKYMYRFGVVLNYFSDPKRIRYVLYYKEDDNLVDKERFVFK